MWRQKRRPSPKTFMSRCLSKSVRRSGLVAKWFPAGKNRKETKQITPITLNPIRFKTKRLKNFWARGSRDRGGGGNEIKSIVAKKTRSNEDTPGYKKEHLGEDTGRGGTKRITARGKTSCRCSKVGAVGEGEGSHFRLTKDVRVLGRGSEAGWCGMLSREEENKLENSRKVKGDKGPIRREKN